MQRKKQSLKFQNPNLSSETNLPLNACGPACITHAPHQAPNYLCLASGVMVPTHRGAGLASLLLLTLACNAVMWCSATGIGALLNDEIEGVRHPAYPSDCLPRQVTRPCVTFEVPAPGYGGKCLCPGYGPAKKSFSLIVDTMSFPGLQPTPRTLIVANQSLPGPAIVVNQGDWLEVTVTNAMTVSRLP